MALAASERKAAHEQAAIEAQRAADRSRSRKRRAAKPADGDMAAACNTVDLSAICYVTTCYVHMAHAHSQQGSTDVALFGMRSQAASFTVAVCCQQAQQLLQRRPPRMRTGPWSRGRSLLGCSQTGATTAAATWNRRSTARGTLVSVLGQQQLPHIRRQPCRSLHRLILLHLLPQHSHTRQQLLPLQPPVAQPVSTKQQKQHSSVLATSSCARHCSPE